MTQKYRKKPVVIEAIQFTGENLDDCLVFTGVSRDSAEGCKVMKLPFFVETLEGTMRVSPGDWVIKGVKGEFYLCDPEIFEATYEPADFLKELEGTE